MKADNLLKATPNSKQTVAKWRAMKWGIPATFIVVAFLLLAGSNLFSTGAMVQGPTCVQPPAGLVSWYPGDGNANDIQDGNNGTLQNGAGFAPGKVGQAFLFDGVDDNVTIPDAANLEFTTMLSIDAWINPNAVETTKPGILGNRIVDKSTQFGADGYLLDIFSGKLRLVIDGTTSLLGATTIPLNTWTHVAGTYDGTTMKLYVNGVLDGSLARSGTIPTNNLPLRIGASQANQAPREVFSGQIDEVEIFSRALTQAEIQSIVNAGTAGKCKPAPACVTAPANLVSWYPGDGNANDIQDGNNGTLQNGAGFAPGKVGQAFLFDGVDDNVTIPDAANLEFTTMLSIDAWINPNAVETTKPGILGNRIVDKSTQFGADGYLLDIFSGKLRLVIDGTTSLLGATTIPLNTWTHVAGTYDGTTMKLYVNGVLDGSLARSGTIPTNNLPLRIGASQANQAPREVFSGQIDEVEIFSRALTQAEVQSIVNAGSSGKCRPTAGADLSLLKSSSQQGQANANSNITYTLTVTNNSAGTAQNVIVSDPIPANTTYVANSATTNCGTVSFANNTVTANLGNIASGQSCIVTLTVKVNVSAPNGTVITNTATVSSNGTDPNPANNTAIATNTVNNPPPVLTSSCPANITTTAPAACNSGGSATVTFTPPTAASPLTGLPATVVCKDQTNRVVTSGSSFPVGTSTVTCIGTDAAGQNSNSCSFTINVVSGLSNVCLQDDSNANTVVVFNLITGDYRYCCNGVLIKQGTGTVQHRGCIYTITHNTKDRRVSIQVDFSTNRGEASVQSPPGTVVCTVNDRNILDNTNCAVCSGP